MSRLPDALGEGHVSEVPNAELDVGILAGDQRAIGRWHDRIGPVVRRVLHRKGIRDEEAEEIFDDVFVSTIRHAVTITPLGSGLRPYIMGAVRRKIADHFEATKTRVETVPLRDDDDAEAETPGQPDPVAAVAIARSAAATTTSVSAAVQRLQNCLDKVEPGVRRLAELWMDESTDDEIAEALGIAKTSVRKYVQRMKAALQQCIEGED
jgi:RNA polymerase sigma factor (sigma-70 family)